MFKKLLKKNALWHVSASCPGWQKPKEPVGYHCPPAWIPPTGAADNTRRRETCIRGRGLSGPHLCVFSRAFPNKTASPWLFRLPSQNTMAHGSHSRYSFLTVLGAGTGGFGWETLPALQPAAPTEGSGCGEAEARRRISSILVRPLSS